VDCRPLDLPSGIILHAGFFCCSNLSFDFLLCLCLYFSLLYICAGVYFFAFIVCALYVYVAAPCA